MVSEYFPTACGYSCILSKWDKWDTIKGVQFSQLDRYTLLQRVIKLCGREESNLPPPNMDGTIYKLIEITISVEDDTNLPRGRIHQ
jgi:hypothetical protein